LLLLSTDFPTSDVAHIQNKIFPATETVHFQKVHKTVHVHESFLENTTNLLEDFIFEPIQMYNSKILLLKKDQQHCEFITKLEADSKAQDTTMILAEEHTVSPKILRSLINKEVSKELRKLQITKKHITSISMDANNTKKHNKPNNASRGQGKVQTHQKHLATEPSQERASSKKKSHLGQTTTLTHGQQHHQNSNMFKKQKSQRQSQQWQKRQQKSEKKLFKAAT
jgi:hypothetical protein